MRLCDQCHAAHAIYLVHELDLAFCQHHWDEKPESIKEMRHSKIFEIAA